MNYTYEHSTKIQDQHLMYGSSIKVIKKVNALNVFKQYSEKENEKIREEKFLA